MYLLFLLLWLLCCCRTDVHAQAGPRDHVRVDVGVVVAGVDVGGGVAVDVVGVGGGAGDVPIG